MTDEKRSNRKPEQSHRLFAFDVISSFGIYVIRNVILMFVSLASSQSLNLILMTPQGREFNLFYEILSVDAKKKQKHILFFAVLP